MDRNKKARKEAKEKKQQENWRKTVEEKQLQDQYVSATITGRYFFARCNMIATQIQSGEIKETIDGMPKPEEYLRAEYALEKKKAIDKYRDAHHAKMTLLEEHDHTEEDLQELLKDVYNGKIIREEYDETFRRKSKAHFAKQE